MTDFVQRLIARAVEPAEVLLPRPVALFEPSVGLGASAIVADGSAHAAPAAADWIPDPATPVPGPRGGPFVAPAAYPVAGAERDPPGARRTTAVADPAVEPVAPGALLPPRPPRETAAPASPPAPGAVPVSPRPPTHTPPAPVLDRVSGRDRTNQSEPPDRPAGEVASTRRRRGAEERPVEPTHRVPPVARERIIREIAPAARDERGRGSGGDADAALPEIIRRMVLRPVRREEVRERVIERVPESAGSQRGSGLDGIPEPNDAPPARRPAGVEPRLAPIARGGSGRPLALTPRAPLPAVLESVPPAAPPTTIQVRIGRIEVRATPEAAVPSPAPPAPAPPRARVMTLDEYLAGGDGRGR